MQTAELVSTGAELLSGRTVNAHAHVLGEHLARIGSKLLRDTTVPDNIELIIDAVEGALSRANLVFVTGGLGPTSDDLTREALSRFLNRKIVMDEEMLNIIRKRYEQHGKTLSLEGKKQAETIEGAEILNNAVGAAPGKRIEVDGSTLFALPGPPREFLYVLEQHVLPWLKENMVDPLQLHENVFMICGMGESDILTRFAAHAFPPDGIDIAFCAAPGRVEIRLSTSSDASTLQKAIAEIRKLLGDFIYAEERIDLSKVLGRYLQERQATLATAESCTGGLLADRITSVSGSSQYYRGGVVAYSNDVKIQALGVDPQTFEKHGAVSEWVAKEMAQGVRQRFNTDYGLGITGIAGPTGGTQEKPIGLVFIAVADHDQTDFKEYQFSGNRTWIKENSSQMALDVLRRFLGHISM
ncbi:MAG: competence/damage-inducible protein A [Kiritimatiellae bacterium]|nr:competence/damage-inducible protein A [Kiritimatiellia bacterium]